MMIESRLSSLRAGPRTNLARACPGLDDLLKAPLMLPTLLAMVFLLLGCGQDSEAGTTAELAASFEGSPAKEDVIKANAAFEEGRKKSYLVFRLLISQTGFVIHNSRIKRLPEAGQQPVAHIVSVGFVSVKFVLQGAVLQTGADNEACNGKYRRGKRPP